MEAILGNFKSMLNPSCDEEEEPKTKQLPNYANQVFKLPIDDLNEDTYNLSSIVSSDLELVLGENSMYGSLFNPSNEFAKQIMPLYQEKYTTNTKYLLETQQVIENMSDFEHCKGNVDCKKIQENWTDVKHDPKFMETYGYLEWSMLEECNRSSIVLQTISLTNMLSPVMSFFIPILFLLFPFVILKIQGIPITMTMYLEVLREIAKHHFIGKALSTFESFSIQNLIYLLGMLGLYGLQMYQNTTQCLRFYRNMQKINDELCTWKDFVDRNISQIDCFVKLNNTYSTYKTFCERLTKKKKVLIELREMLSPICPFSCSIFKTTEVGYMLKCYYEMHTNSEIENTLLFCMGFEGYLELMSGANKQLLEGVVNKASFCEDPIVVVVDGSDNKIPECYINQQYYPPHKDEDSCVKNDVTLDSFSVITGPNASGKTTFLKTTAINIILAQQLGIGFFDSCMLRPYTDIHSYLNIPDTSGRDSLFQAESRRCKEILEKIQKNDGRQFCIFDELYSGTNPKEATKSAYAFLEYLRNYNHVDLLLTTHYVSICDEWSEQDHIKKTIKNYKMIVEETQYRNIPTYKIEPGISRIEGAINILQDMDYPEEMIAMIQDKSDEDKSDEDKSDEDNTVSTPNVVEV